MSALIGVARSCHAIVTAGDAFAGVVVPRQVTRRLRATLLLPRDLMATGAT